MPRGIPTAHPARGVHCGSLDPHFTGVKGGAVHQPEAPCGTLVLCILTECKRVGNYLLLTQISRRTRVSLLYLEYSATIHPILQVESL